MGREIVKEYKPVIHPAEDFGKFPWHKFGYEDLGCGVANMVYVPACNDDSWPKGVPRPKRSSHADAHIKYYLDGPWIELESGAATRPYSIWLVPNGLAFLMESMFNSGKESMRRSIKELLRIPGRY